jgi:hypothetical protein
MTDSIDFDEPGFPYLAFCPISIYDPANHNPEACPYCGPGNEMTDEDIEKIINGDWTPGQIASFERAHEPAPHRANENGLCTCGGRYFLASTMQGNHPAEGTWTQETYYCEGCETWLFVEFDAHGVEVNRRYEVGQL